MSKKPEPWEQEILNTVQNKLYVYLTSIYGVMQEVSKTDISIVNPPADKHKKINFFLGSIDKQGLLGGTGLREEFVVSYWLAKEFVNLYNYYHEWRHNVLGVNLLKSVTNCLECLNNQENYGIKREDDRQTYLTGLNRLRRRYLEKTVNNADASEVVALANSVFKGLRDNVVSLYSFYYEKLSK